ncbi:MAG: UbiX family flavin prenyltransferase [Gammaproteobacteria bacterium]
MRLIVGMSGASGLIYGIRLLQVLHDLKDVETHLILSPSAKMNISLETEWQLADVEALANEVHNVNNVAAKVSSGSFRTEGMILAPCSMKTLSGIAHSYADNLLVRAADVVLKERRRLVLMPRETPLHTGHCRLLYEVSQIGAIVAPPVPAFYIKPATIDDLINHSIGRILDLFGLDPGIVNRWAGVNNRLLGNKQ